jgi:hypothetical protein
MSVILYSIRRIGQQKVAWESTCLKITEIDYLHVGIYWSFHFYRAGNRIRNPDPGFGSRGKKMKRKKTVLVNFLHLYC